MQELKLNLSEVGKEVIIRQGEAQPIREPKSISLSGDINAPFEFYEKRKDLFLHNTIDGSFTYDSQKTNGVINKEAGTVIS